MPRGEPSFSCKFCFISVGQDRQILTRSGSGEPELLRRHVRFSIDMQGPTDLKRHPLEKNLAAREIIL